MRRTVAVMAVVAALMAVTWNVSTAPPAQSALGPKTPHLVVLLLENKEYTDVVGNRNAPYLNSTLIAGGRLFTQYFGVAHPSLPGYLVITAGKYGTCVTDTCTVGIDPAENIFHLMNVASTPITWKTYAEGMPSNCYGSNSGGYAARHNPAVYYRNLGPSGDGSCSRNDVPLSQLPVDLAAGALPAFSFVVPDLYDDMHTNRNQAPCVLGDAKQNTICQGDTWLAAHVPALLSDGGRNDVTLVVTFDEGSSGKGGGGQVMTVEVGPTTCKGCTESRPYNHYGLTNAIQRWFQLPYLLPPAPTI